MSMVRWNETTPMKDANDYLRPFEIDRLMKVLDNRRDYVLFQTLLKTGRRVSEVIRSLKPSDMDIDSQIIVWNILKKKPRKTEEQKLQEREPMRVIIKIRKELMDMLISYINQSKIKYNSYIFPISRQRVDQLIKKYGIMIGLPKNRRHVHIFRHTFISEGMRKGIRPDLMMRQAQHSSIDMTMHYSHYGETEEQEALEKMWND